MYQGAIKEVIPRAYKRARNHLNLFHPEWRELTEYMGHSVDTPETLEEELN